MNRQTESHSHKLTTKVYIIIRIARVSDLNFYQIELLTLYPLSSKCRNLTIFSMDQNWVLYKFLILEMLFFKVFSQGKLPLLFSLCFFQHNFCVELMQIIILSSITFSFLVLFLVFNILFLMGNWLMVIFPLSGQVQPCKVSPEVWLSTRGQTSNPSLAGKKALFSK